MSHRDSCPPRWEAERQGERAFERGYGSNPYRGDFHDEGCPEAERAWRSGFYGAERREEERREEERIERQRHEARRAQRDHEAEQEAAYYEDMQQQQYDEYQAQMEEEERAHYADLWRHEFVDLPQFADDGGREPMTPSHSGEPTPAQQETNG